MADEARSQYAAPLPSLQDAVEEAESSQNENLEAVTTIHPSLAVSERYDSNVYFIPGRNLQDYVTTITPQVKVDHRGRLVDFMLLGGVSGNYYLRNPGLSYIGANGSTSINLTRWVARALRGASLQVSDSAMYTPQPPAFIAPVSGNVVNTGFVQGVQAGRANSFSNLAQAVGGYRFNSTTAFQANYVYGYMHFGSRFVPTGTTSPFTSSNFFTTQYQIATAGPNFQVSPRDSINVDYQYQQMSFSLGTGSKFEMQGGMVGWKRKLTPTLLASATGGFTVITPGNTVQYTGNALVQWEPDKATTVKLQYQRSVRPSFFLIGVPLISQTYMVYASRKLTERLSIWGNANYAQSSAVSSSVSLSYTSYSLSAGTNYQLTEHVVATLSYSYNNFVYSVVSGETAFNRNVVSLGIRAEW